MEGDECRTSLQPLQGQETDTTTVTTELKICFQNINDSDEIQSPLHSFEAFIDVNTSKVAAKKSTEMSLCSKPFNTNTVQNYLLKLLESVTKCVQQRQHCYVSAESPDIMRIKGKNHWNANVTKQIRSCGLSKSTSFVITYFPPTVSAPRVCWCCYTNMTKIGIQANHLKTYVYIRSACEDKIKDDFSKGPFWSCSYSSPGSCSRRQRWVQSDQYDAL